MSFLTAMLDRLSSDGIDGSVPASSIPRLEDSLSPQEPSVPNGRKYLDIKGHIIGVIELLPVGAAIPPERALAQSCGASRATVRKAVAELVTEGRLVRRRGSGTYVTEPKLRWPLTFANAADQAAAEGVDVHTSLLCAARAPATAEVAERLGIRAGAPVLSIELLRRVGGVPVAMESRYLPARRYPGLTAAAASTAAGPEDLHLRFGINVTHAVGSIETMPARPREAALLHTEAGSPVLLVSRRSHAAEGDVVEWVRACYRGDRASFVTRLTAAGART